MHGHVVHIDLERAADLVGARVHMHGTDADLALPLGATASADVQGVQRLVAVADRPPTLDVRHHQVRYTGIAPFGDLHVHVGGDAVAGERHVYAERFQRAMGIVGAHNASCTGTFHFDGDG